DVSQLNHDLVALGDAGSAEIAALGWDYYSWETQAGAEKLQSALGVSFPPGSLPLGQVVFEPEALRVSQVSGSLGGLAAGPVMALLAQAPSGYDVEVADRGNTRRWVPVAPGIFDDTDGLVQVTGALTPGQRVVVPAT